MNPFLRFVLITTHTLTLYAASAATAEELKCAGNRHVVDKCFDLRGRILCHGKSSSKTLREATAPTSIKHVGKVLAGYDTATCTREDIQNDRYSKQFMAFRPWQDMEEVDDLYTIAAYVRTKNKDTANRLLESDPKSYKLLK